MKKHPRYKMEELVNDNDVMLLVFLFFFNQHSIRLVCSRLNPDLIVFILLSGWRVFTLEREAVIAFP